MPRPTTLPVARPRSYRAFLESRWAPRARLLALYALNGIFVMLAFDVVFTRQLVPAPSLLRVAATRLPLALISFAGLALAARAGPRSRWLPPAVVALSVAWTWGNSLCYLALGLAGTVVQTVGVVLCFITAATFIPVRFRGRVVIFALMAAGHVALDLAWPQQRTVWERLWSDAAILGLVGVETVLFESLAGNQRRRFIVQRDLELKVTALEASRRRARLAADDLGRLAARVAHDVNNPLAAVKVNVRWLGEPHDPAERGEVVTETLEAVGRIARSVAALGAPAVTPAPARQDDPDRDRNRSGST